jgi:hypothetical protein
MDKEMPDDGAVTGPRVDGLLVRGDVHGCDGLVVPLQKIIKVKTNAFCPLTFLCVTVSTPFLASSKGN